MPHPTDPPAPSANIQAHLTRLVLGSLLPAVLAATFLIGYFYERGKASLEQDTLATARALTLAVDRELASGRTALQALATSPLIVAGDLAAFDRQAREVLREVPGNNIVVSDATGQQVLNTLRRYGDPLPRHGNPAQLKRVFETGQAVVSDLYVGAVVRRPVIGIDVPVRRDGRVVYDMSMGFFPDRLAAILKGQRLPAEWVGVIIDSQGTIAARTRDGERYVGQRAAARLVDALARSTEGWLQARTVEGTEALVVFSRSSQSNWTVAIAIPQEIFASQLRASLLKLIAGTLVLLSGGLVLAYVLGARIRGAIHGLIAPAAALARGEQVTVPPLELTEANEVAQALEEASKVLRDREEILAVVTHDLRSPLSGIAMVASSVEREAAGLPEGGRLRASAAMIRQSAQGMSGLVDDLLAITVAHSGQSMLKIARIEASSVVADAVHLALPQLEGAGLEVTVEAGGALPDVEVDLQRMLRVFRNLFDNAVKFTEAGGRIVVRAEAHPAGVRFSVANSGPALSPAQLEAMFRRFWQPQPDRRGAGLGLSICRTIVDIHGGHIWAEAQDGMRVRVCIDLPAAPQGEPALTTPSHR